MVCWFARLVYWCVGFRLCRVVGTFNLRVRRIWLGVGVR